MRRCADVPLTFDCLRWAVAGDLWPPAVAHAAHQIFFCSMMAAMSKALLRSAFDGFSYTGTFGSFTVQSSVLFYIEQVGWGQCNNSMRASLRR